MPFYLAGYLPFIGAIFATNSWRIRNGFAEQSFIRPLNIPQDLSLPGIKGEFYNGPMENEAKKIRQEVRRKTIMN